MLPSEVSRNNHSMLKWHQNDVKSMPHSEFAMEAIVKKKISAELPLASFEIVRLAAELKGSTIRSFAAAAIFEEAIRVTQSVAQVRNQLNREVLSFSPSEMEALIELLKNPEPCRNGLEKALALSSSHRDIPVPEEDRL